jgi:hypothetical protein
MGRLDVALYLDQFLWLPSIFVSRSPNKEFSWYFGYEWAISLSWLWFEMEIVRPTYL